jgi:hypothetical protein
MRKRIGRAVAWLVTLGALAYIFSTVSPAEVAANVRKAAGWTAPVLTLLIGCIYLADSFAIWRTFGWFLARLSFREVLVVRGATYLLAQVNYAIGQGAMIYFVNRSRGVPVLRGAAAVLLVMGVNVLVLLLSASAGLLVAPDVPAIVRTVVYAGYAGLIVYLVLVAARPRWLTSKPNFDVLMGAGLRGHLKAVVVRLPHLLSLMVFTYASLHAFGIDVPPLQAVLLLPVVYFVAVLPISVQGVGPTQALMAFFFVRYAPGNNPRALVYAASFTSQAVAMVVQSLIGLACFRNQLARDLGRAPTTT